MSLSRLKIPLKLLSVLLFVSISCSDRDYKAITVLETTDVHGTILPYDYIEKKEVKNSQASAYSIIKQVRSKGNKVILLDGGDNLQGQPPVYFYNFIDTVSEHLNASIMNFMKYDACTAGNHDIEAGHEVYDRLAGEYKFPWLAANAVNKKTGKPYFKPYAVIEKSGVRVAVLGMITPEVPTWLPPELYSGIEFRDMVETAKLWMPVIKKERPDIIIGLFHSGWDEKHDQASPSGHHDENGSYAVAVNVPGFDLIMCGHDHKVVNKKIINSAGDSVLILDGGSRSEKIAEAEIQIPLHRTNKLRNKLTGKIIDIEGSRPDDEFVSRFLDQDNKVKQYVNKVIARSENDISTRDSYFGSSAFVDMIHRVQLEITHADVSFAAPLSFDAKISAGPVTVGDMFKLYRFENQLYTMSLTGKEIKDYLEFSYSGWLNTMTGPGDIMLKLKLDDSGNPLILNGAAWFRNQPYNFDSAAGIDYIVDVSKPDGDRIRIKSFSDGRPFISDSTYKVAINSYRGNGGGGHLTEGANIPANDLQKRLVASTERDLRYYILKELEKERIIRPRALDNWKIIPEKWVSTAKAREYKLLFGNKG
jgi:2',3'-cyclic-nucleotide 2'-phosphodiesterase/3'-nucleotidase